jgi:hypothetical protein
MANNENLEKAYDAISALRVKGLLTMDVRMVANTAGIARSTFYLNDPDWKEVRAVIAGKPSDRVKLKQVKVVKRSHADQRIEEFSLRLAEAENEVIRIQEVAQKVYRQLIDEVQRWFVKASESPAKKNQIASYLQELVSSRKEVERLSSENRLLEAKVAVAGVVHPLVQKKVICLNALESPVDMFTSFLKQFDALNPQHEKAHGVVATYVMCGLPLSGKSYWIELHRPSEPGVHIYVDSCAHTRDARRFIADRIRHISKSDVHCVWLRANSDTFAERDVVIDATGRATLKKAEIERVASGFEPPTLGEPFDSIILPRERL